jgi:hypothetical protein
MPAEGSGVRCVKDAGNWRYLTTVEGYCGMDEENGTIDYDHNGVSAMPHRWPALLIGILLLAIAAVWFFTPLGGRLLAGLGITPMYGNNPAGGPSTFDIINMGLTGANAVFAAIGAYLTALGLRPKN